MPCQLTSTPTRTGNGVPGRWVGPEVATRCGETLSSGTFGVTEPAAVFYTVDGSAPTYSSVLYGSAGIREGGETLTLPVGTEIHWFSVDSAGNVENNYTADGGARNYRKGQAVLPTG